MTLDGSSSGSNNIVSVTVDGTQFTVDDDGTPTPYSTSNDDTFVYNGSAGTFSKLIFDDPSNTYSVTQTLTGTQLTSNSGFQLDLNNVSNLYVYGNSNSTATVNVPTGTESNFFVDDVNGGYSYIADPTTAPTANCRASAARRSPARPARCTRTSTPCRMPRLSPAPRKPRLRSEA